MRSRPSLRSLKWGLLILLFSSGSAWSHTFCDQVCTTFEPIGSVYLILVTDADSGELLATEQTSIPSNLSPSPVPPGSGGPIVIPHDAKDDAGLAGSGPNVPAPDTFTYTFSGPNGDWIVTITLVYGPEGQLVDVSTTVTFVPQQGQER